MLIVSTQRWKSLEERRAMAFLVAGVLWLADTVLLGIELFTGVSILGTPGTVNPILYMSGLVAAIVGLLGFYPELAGRTPRLARISAVLVAVAGVAISVLLVWLVTVTLLGQPDPPGVLLILSLLVVVLGFILFGIASVQTGVPSRTVGFLVLAIPTTLFAGLVLGYVLYSGDSPDWTSPAIGVVMSLLLLAIGVLLRSEGVPTDRAEPAPDSTAR